MSSLAENARAAKGDNSTDAGKLEDFFTRIESVNSEIKQSQEFRKEIFSEAKSQGYDLPTMRAVLKLRAMDPSDRLEQDEMLDLYLSACPLRR